MISSYNIYNAECDKCGKSFNEVLEEEITSMRELETALKDNGWESKGYYCLCDKCK